MSLMVGDLTGCTAPHVMLIPSGGRRVTANDVAEDGGIEGDRGPTGQGSSPETTRYLTVQDRLPLWRWCVPKAYGAAWQGLSKRQWIWHRSGQLLTSVEALKMALR